MTTHASRGGLSLRDVEPEDVPALSRWFSDPRVLRFYGGRDASLAPEDVRRKFLQTRRDSSGRTRNYQPCVIEQDRVPVGFLQFYRLTPRESTSLGYAPRDRTFGFDLLVGDPGLWGHGLGTRAVRMTRDFLRKEWGADWIVLDPRVENRRAVHVYRKAGFRSVRRLPAHEFHEGKMKDCWLMQFP